MSRKRKYKIDVCAECKVRNGDYSKKRLYQCNYCERWFCEKHLEPRLAVMKDLTTTIEDAAWRDLVEKDWKREDGHLDYSYTQEKLAELKVKNQIIRAKMDVFLNKSTVHRRKSRKTHGIKGERRSDFSRHLKAPLIATFIIALLIGAAVLLPIVALAGEPVIFLLGILGLFFLIFLLLEYGRD